MSCNFVSALSAKTIQITPSPQITAPTIQVNWDVENQIFFTEMDVTNWIEVFSGQNPDFRISEPQVQIGDGLCSISGILTPVNSGNGNPIYNSLSGKIDLQLSLDLDNDKNLRVAISSLKLNDVDMPQFAIDRISDMINSSILSSLDSELNGRSINQITLSDGIITITLDPI